MFASLSFKDLKKSKSFDYAAELPFFQTHKSLAFKPGLTVLFGPNGCGKSTVLRMLGDTLCATQGGVSSITETAVRELLGGGRAVDPVGLKVEHDGQPVLFCDPRKPIGLAGSSFDDDFFEAGLEESMSANRLSHGQNGARRINRILAVLAGQAQAPTAITRWRKASEVNSTWAKGLEVLEQRVAGTLPKGPLSILLDEPESYFSPLWQTRIWDVLARPAVLEQFQIIVASHSLFSLGIPGATYVEFQPGYVEEATGALVRKAQTLLG